MNGHCGICDVEQECGYEYKPCDCCGYRKFKPKAEVQRSQELDCRPLAKVIPIHTTLKEKP